MSEGAHAVEGHVAGKTWAPVYRQVFVKPSDYTSGGSVMVIDQAIETTSSTDQIHDVGELLKYGLPGLALGIFLAAIVFGVAWKAKTNSTDALKVVLGFGLCFLIVGGFFTIYLSTRNPQVRVEVMVDPNPSDLKLPMPEIHSKLSSKPDHDMVLVRDADYVKVDITGILRAYDTAKQEKDSLINRLAMVEQSTSSALATARLIVPSEAHAIELSSVSSQPGNPVAAAADIACAKNGGASCGWAQLARGHTADAQAQFEQVAADASLIKQQRAAGYNGLGYTYITQGKTEAAAAQFKRSSELGDKEATLQLQTLDAQKAETAVKHGD